MKLDPRIKALSDILTCFDIERAEQFIGQNGYFADAIACYRCLSNRPYGTLTHIKDGEYPFKEDKSSHWRFFIPECSLKPKEKQYRPLSIDEFLNQFDIGEVIVFRSKVMPNIVCHVLFDGYTETDKETFVILGLHHYSLKELFSNYEYDNGDNWLCFGVEE